MSQVQEIWTLGPKGTNCEAAAYHYLETRNNGKGEVHLCRTLEEALTHVLGRPERALMGCIAYPDLHEIIFQNLSGLKLTDVFVFPTFNMVTASRNGQMPDQGGCFISHPAPSSLVKGNYKVAYATSNAAAAIACADQSFDACVTTMQSATQHGLKVIRDFGPVNMGFSIHTPCNTQ